MPRPLADVPTSTYRLHLTHAFTLNDAAELVDYLDDLGVGWLYASPIQTVPPGATHGYHITDPDQVNPELGGDRALQRLHARLQRHGMGLVLDIVPNHMAASPLNAWWSDVLRHGPQSVHAATFDIDFDAGPLVLPILGEPLDQAVADGAITVHDDHLVVYGDLRLPMAPGTATGPLADVLANQHYRLAEWRSGEAVLNWRRFFAVNELAGVRVEDPDVFDAVHATIMGWVEDGIVDGLRVDHIDGLRDPAGYLQSLRRRLGLGRWLVVEKILDQGEDLPIAWPVAGTTGYEVNAMIQAWLTDADGHQQLRRDFADLTGLPADTVATLPESKLAVLDELFVAEVERVARVLTAPTSDDASEGPDLPVIRDGIRHLTAHLQGYRTYAPPHGPIDPSDIDAIQSAAVRATAAGHPEAATVASLLDLPEAREALLRWQQLTGPAAAKGFEDRLLYRQVGLSGLCEVGSDAGFLDHLPAPAAVAQFLSDRAARNPTAGTTTSTHDTKRSEDVRARLTVLAEVPDAFTALLADVTTMLADAGHVADAHARWVLLQTVLGTLDLDPQDPLADGVPSDGYRERLGNYAEKALREAEVHTSHRDPDPDYEAGIQAWLGALLTTGPALDAVRALVDRIALPAACTSLSTLVMKLAAPGVPDIYRGCEVWDASLADPDNRRPLNVAGLRATLASIGDDPAAIRDSWRDGAIKMLVTSRGLHLRRRLPDVLVSTIAESPTVKGGKADHVAALLRRADDQGPRGVADPGARPKVLALATRLPLGMTDGSWPIGDVWEDTEVEVEGVTAAVDRLSGRDVPVRNGHVRLADALAVLPVAMLELT